MKKILFIDVVCRENYYPFAASEPNNKIGGSELVLMNVAEELAKLKDVSVTIALHTATKQYKGRGVTYIPLDDVDMKEPWYAVIFQRSMIPVTAFAELNPHSLKVVWLHDLIDQTYAMQGKVVEGLNPYFVYVSKSHMEQGLNAGMPKKRAQVIYNPVNERFLPKPLERDKNRLIWLSSPHKGLAQAITVFKWLHKRNPELKLYTANPGYYEREGDLPEGVIDLGKLAHTDAMQELAKSLCLFMPQIAFPARETFGCVFAESLALGVPVIAHHVGSAKEVLGEYAIDCSNISEIEKKIKSWQEKLPKPTLQDKFRLSSVMEEWKKLLRLD